MTLIVRLCVIVVLAALTAASRAPVWAWAPLLLYGLLLLGSAARLVPRVGVTAAALTIPLFFLYHLGYGAGTLLGLFSLRRLERTTVS